MRIDVLALVLAKRRALRRREHWTHDRIGAHQRARLAELVRHAASR